MTEGLLFKLNVFCKANDCEVEFNTYSQVYEVKPKVKIRKML